MTLTKVIIDGAEHKNIAFWDSAGGATLNTTNTHTGNASWNISTSECKKNLPADSDVVWARFWLYTSSNNVNWAPIVFGHSSKGYQNRLYLNTQHVLTIQREGTVLATGTTVIEVDRWYMIEVGVYLDNTSGWMKCYVDGNLDSTYSGDTLANNSYLYINYFEFDGTGTGTQVQVDDICIATGLSTDTSPIGDGRVYGIFPNADGSETEWTGDYTDVDEAPPDNDGSTDLTTTTSGDRSTFDLESLTPTDTILAVQVVGHAMKDDAADDNLNIGIIDNSNEDTAAVELSAGTRNFIAGDIFTTRPAGGGAWTKTVVDSLQVVVEAP